MDETLDSDGARPRRGQAREVRRSEIIDTAAEIFRTKGYAATSIQDIADAVGMLKGSLYYYIDSKEDLLAAVIGEAHRRGMEWVELLEDTDGDALARLRAFVKAHIANVTANLVSTSVFFHEFRSLSGARRADIITKRDRYDTFLRELLEQGKREGAVCEDVDAKLTSMAILGMVNWVYHWYRPQGPSTPEEIGSAFADLVVGGLRCSCPEGRHERAGTGRDAVA